MVATPYKRQWNIRTTAEGWIGRFRPFFLQNVNFAYVGKLWKKIGAFFRCFCPPNWPFLLGVGPFSNIEGLPSPSILARAPQFWQKPPLSTASKMLDQARSPRSSHSPAPQFWQKPLNFGKVVVPKKNGQFWGGKKNLCTPKKKVMLGNGYAMCFLQKKMKKICQIWPRQTLKHFTAALMEFPPCTQSQKRDRVLSEMCPEFTGSLWRFQKWCEQVKLD